MVRECQAMWTEINTKMKVGQKLHCCIWVFSLCVLCLGLFVQLQHSTLCFSVQGGVVLPLPCSTFCPLRTRARVLIFQDLVIGPDQIQRYEPICSIWTLATEPDKPLQMFTSRSFSGSLVRDPGGPVQAVDICYIFGQPDVFMRIFSYGEKTEWDE